MNTKRGVLKFKNSVLPKQPSELFRLRVLAGKDLHCVYVVTQGRVAVGRDEQNDLILNDLKTSRKHAEFIFTNGSCVVRDLGSSHGVRVNGRAVAMHPLRPGDKLSIGETILEYIATSVQGAGATQMLVRPPVELNKGQVESLIPGLKQNAAHAQVGVRRTESFLEKNKKLMFILGGLMLLAGLLPEVEQKQRIKKSQYLDPRDIENERSLASVGVSTVDPQVQKNSDVYFKEGFRDFRAKNYLRAMSAFDTALQINPEHPLARVYLESTKKAMEREGKDYLARGKRNEDANRYEQAKSNYDAVKRLYFLDQTNPLFKEAEEKSNDMDKKIKDINKS